MLLHSAPVVQEKPFGYSANVLNGKIKKARLKHKTAAGRALARKLFFIRGNRRELNLPAIGLVLSAIVFVFMAKTLTELKI